MDVRVTSAARHGRKRLDGPRRAIVDAMIADLASGLSLPRECMRISSMPYLHRMSRRDVRLLLAVADDGRSADVVDAVSRSSRTYCHR